MGKGKKKTVNAPTCTVKNCKIRMEPGNICVCLKCKQNFCNNHQYPSDHDCNPVGNATTGASKPSSSGLLVVMNNSSSKTNNVKGNDFPSLTTGSVGATKLQTSFNQATSSNRSSKRNDEDIKDSNFKIYGNLAHSETENSISDISSVEKTLDQLVEDLVSQPIDKILAQLADNIRKESIDEQGLQQVPLLFQILDSYTREMVIGQMTNSDDDKLKENWGKIMEILQQLSKKAHKRPSGAVDSSTLLVQGLETFLGNASTTKNRNGLAKTNRNGSADLDMHDIRWCSALILYAVLSCKNFKNPELLHKSVEQIISWCRNRNTKAAGIVGPEIAGDILTVFRKNCHSLLGDSHFAELAQANWEEMQTLANLPNETEAMKRSALFIGAISRGVGVTSLGSTNDETKGYGIFDASLSLMQKANKKFSQGHFLGSILLEAIAIQCERLAEPMFISRHVVDKCVQAYAQAAPQAKDALLRTLELIIQYVLGPYGVNMCMSGIGRSLEDPSWRVRAGALQILKMFAEKKPDDLFISLQNLMPLVMKSVVDTRKEVVEAANQTLDALGKIVTNPETQKLMPYLIKAIKEPDSTDKFLEELMDLTIVNSLDAQSLALILPVVVRGLREGGNDTAFKAVVATGNVCNIVRRVADLKPFVPVLQPCLMNLLHHSSPEIRDGAQKAIDTLESSLGKYIWEQYGDDVSNAVTSNPNSNQGISPLKNSSNSNGGHLSPHGNRLTKSPLHSGHMTPFDYSQISFKIHMLLGLNDDNDDSFGIAMSELALEPSVKSTKTQTTDDIESEENQTLNKNSNPENIRDTMSDQYVRFVTECMSWLLRTEIEHSDVPVPKKEVMKQVNNLVGDLLEEAYLSKSVQVLEKLAVMVHAFLLKIFKRSGDDVNEEDIIVDIPNIILAFASRVLLKRAHLRFLRGHRYAVIGQNGVGKTTLVTRIAAKDIQGFPDTVSTFYVQHEILTEGKGMTVSEFMLKNCELANVAADSANNIDKDEARASEALKEVGFSDEMIQSKVESLSGGWRMRLAIARSMLYEKDILVCDEPTNHLSEAAVQWLAGYLNSLDCTVIVVSHDYEFLSAISTDVIHVVNQNLETYAGTFAQFQQEHPDIVAALPKPGKRINEAQESTSLETPDLDVNEVEKSSNTENNGVPDREGAVSAAPSEDSQGSSMTNASDSQGHASSTFDLLNMGGKDAIQKMEELGILPMKFPDPGRLEGITSRGKPVMKMTNVMYSYPGTDITILKDLNCSLSLNSRVCLVGENGAGKSTLLKLLVGELEINEEEGDAGEVWKHHNLRTAYIAQDSMHHLESSVEQTPVQYLQRRFYEGRDKEAAKMITLSLTEDEQQKCEEKGEICGILSRVKRGKQMYYEVDIQGRRSRADRDFGRPGAGSQANKDFRSFSQLQALKKPHVMKLVRMFDEKMKAEASGMDIRPITTEEILKHLKDFGVGFDIAQRKIRWMSGGQRARLVIAAAFWTKPHLVACDEPTNYLDPSTVAVLTHALKVFKGGVVTVSHESSFVEALCNELWHVKDGKISVEKTKQGQLKEAQRKELGATRTVQDATNP